MSYRAVLFDLDGTLLYTLKDLADAVNAALEDLGFPQHAVEAYRYFVGDGREAMCIRALPETWRDEATVDRLVKRVGEEYSTCWADNTRPYQGVPELLSALTKLGINMAILSNKPQSYTEVMVSRLLAAWHFDFVVGAQPSVPTKPDPTAALQIAKQLDVRPAKCLFLGDSSVDMKTAAAAGMYPIGALWGFRTADELLSGGARVLIECPTDLLQLLYKV